MKRGKNRTPTAKGNLLSKLSSFCCLFLVLSACSQNSIYEKNSTINDQLWFRQHMPEFEVHTLDTNQKFDVFINLRHSSSYKYSNLSLIVEEINPQKEEKAYPLDIQLAESDGLWKGIGTGNVLSYQVPLLQDYHFADTGTYTFRIKQNMTINPLPGILDVGIQILK